MIGTGTQGRYLLQSILNHQGTQIVAVSDVDTARHENSEQTVEEAYQANRDGWRP